MGIRVDDQTDREEVGLLTELADLAHVEELIRNYDLCDSQVGYETASVRRVVNEAIAGRAFPYDLRRRIVDLHVEVIVAAAAQATRHLSAAIDAALGTPMTPALEELVAAGQRALENDSGTGILTRHYARQIELALADPGTVEA